MADDIKFEWATDGPITVLGGQHDASQHIQVFVFDRPVIEADKPFIEARMRDLIMDGVFPDDEWRELAS